MTFIANIPEVENKKRIVIVGGGFAGLELSKKLDRKYYQVVLIDKNNYYQFQPLLYQVATGGLEPSSISYPHRKIFQKQKNVHIRMCEATKVNAKEKVLETSIGKVKYDYLVIATGCTTNYFGNEGLKKTTYALKSVSESLLLRNKILLSFEQALSAKSEDELRKLLSFVIVGGGATGVELAGALADMRKQILPKEYPEIDFSKMEIHVVDGSPRLLAAMSEYASTTAAKTLKDRGVIIHHNVFVKSYEGTTISMSNGEELETRNVLWVAGVRPNNLEGLPEESLERGRLSINEFNQVKDQDAIFAIGDTAMLINDDSPKGHPQVAQVAIQMARRLANNFNNKAKNKAIDKFVYNDKGSLATIGKNAAVADLGRFKFGGFVAWWLWLLIHILSIVGMRNKVSVFIDWVWNYFSYDVSLRLFIRPEDDKKIYKEM